MVLAGLINKDIVTAINRQGGKAVGISGKDANLMIARKITEMPDPESNLMQAVDIGYVGDPAEVNPHIVEVISGLRPHPGDRAGRHQPRGRDAQHQRRHLRQRACRAHEGQAAAAADRRRRRARQGQAARSHELSIEEARALIKRRHHLGRHDPQDRGLHRGGGGRRRGASSSSTAACPTACCWSSSPSTASARSCQPQAERAGRRLR